MVRTNTLLHNAMMLDCRLHTCLMLNISGCKFLWFVLFSLQFAFRWDQAQCQIAGDVSRAMRATKLDLRRFQRKWLRSGQNLGKQKTYFEPLFCYFLATFGGRAPESLVGNFLATLNFSDFGACRTSCPSQKKPFPGTLGNSPDALKAFWEPKAPWPPNHKLADLILKTQHGANRLTKAQSVANLTCQQVWIVDNASTCKRANLSPLYRKGISVILARYRGKVDATPPLRDFLEEVIWAGLSQISLLP